jgi:hypothetical protein
MKREPSQDYHYTVVANKIVTIDETEFFQSNGWHSIIKVREEDYPKLINRREVVFFNISDNDNKVGSVYGIPFVYNGGGGYYISEKKYKQFICCYRNIYYGVCVKTVGKMRYEQVSMDLLRKSLWRFKNISDLKRYMVEVYSQSMPLLSEKDILDAGVCATYIKTLGRKNFIKQEKEE